MHLITGGAGFIGSCVAEGLERKGLGTIAICDELGKGDKWKNIAKRNLSDIVPPDRLFDWLQAHKGVVETIIHMGAVSSTMETDVDLIISSNFHLTMRVWDWCAREGIPLLYASSAATYGDGGQGFRDDWSPTALQRLAPLNAYGWSKHLTDRRIVDLVQRNAPAPPQWVGFKFFNVYGPNEWHKAGQQSVVPQLYHQIVSTGAAKLFKSYRDGIPDGGQCRDFIWVDDVVDVVAWFIRNPGVSGIFNVGSGQARSFRDLAEAVFNALGKPPCIQYIDMPETLQAKYQYFTQAEIGSLRHVGYDRQMTTLESGVRQYVQASLMADDPYR